MLVVVAVIGTGPTIGATNRCSRVFWGSLPKESTPVGLDTHLVDVRVGRHACFDRLVLDLDGPRTGYRIAYVDEVVQGGSGNPVPVSGGAIISVVVSAPATDDAGQPTIDGVAVDATNVSRFSTFRDIAWASSFEGQTTIGLGVRARLPFRVFALDGPGRGSRLVVDVAHSWTGGTPGTKPPTPPGEPFDGFPRQGDELGVMGVAYDDALNIRALPGTDQRIVTTAAPTADDLVATGRARRLSRSIWYEVTVNGTTGWASSRFLGFVDGTDDVTASFLRGNPPPAAETMVELGELVAAHFASDDPPSRVVQSVAPSVGDLAEVTYDVIGLGDDSVAGFRLHVFATPHDSGDGFVLTSIESTTLCWRGSDGVLCV
jgi:hypothetical protein